MTGNVPEAFYGLPSAVKFCNRCVMSNQRPASAIEFRHTIQSKKQTIALDETGVCDACRVAEEKSPLTGNFEKKSCSNCWISTAAVIIRTTVLCLEVEEKDSAFKLYILKNKYGMNPLTVTWSPIMYTDYGYENWKKLARHRWI